MRILFEVGSTCVGGAERVILRIAQAIRRTRPDWGIDAVVLCARGGLEEEYQRTFDSVIDGPWRYDLSGDWIIKILKVAAVAGRPYDVVHCIDSFEHTRVAAQMCASCSSQTSRTAFIQNVFPNVDTSPYAPPLNWLLDDDLPYRALVTEYRENAQRLPACPGGVQATRVALSTKQLGRGVVVIPNGIDTGFWCPPSKMEGTETGVDIPIGSQSAAGGLTDRRTIDVLWCARTDAEKGIGTALEVMDQMCSAGKACVMVTSEGDAPADVMSRIEELEEKHSDDSRFAWFYRLSPESLRALFRKTRVFLNTSTVEGMPATPLEALACGCDLVLPKVDGLKAYPVRFTLQEPWSVDRFVDRLTKRLKGVVSPWTSDLQDQWREWVVENYDVEGMTESYVQLYDEVVKLNT